jgi:outer membrane protein insertion porin family
MLWSTGGYEDVQAVQETGAGGAVVAFVLTDRPTIHAVKIEGCQALEVAEARAMFPADGEPFKVAAVAQSVSRLREALVNLGSMQAKVTYEVKKLPERKVDVRVQVVEGTKAVIKSIRFDGLWVAKKADLIGLMDTDEARCNTAGKPYDRDHFARSKLLWTDWYYNHGAVAVRIEDEQLDLVDDGKGVEILVRVKEGPVFRVGSVDLTGDLKVPKTDLVKAVGLTKGEVFSRERIRAAVQRVSALQKEKGGKENVVPLSRVDSEKSVVDLTFEISD